MTRRALLKGIIAAVLAQRFLPRAAMASESLTSAPPVAGGLITSSSAWEHYKSIITPEQLTLLRQAADEYLKLTRLTVVDKTELPKSGDPHDYHSIAPYWWPDPSKPDGVPYIRRDGQVNPEFHHADRTKMDLLADAVSCLIAYAYASGSAPHARHAAALVRGWFLTPETRMNPHLRFAQAIKGVSAGRGIGIIDTVSLCFLLDAMQQLPESGGWTAEDEAGLKAWFGSYLDWLLESGHGKKERGQHNNHGTWYDAQVVCFACYLGRHDLARQQIEDHTLARIRRQIRPDGTQPDEMARTLSLTYCTFNLLGFASIAELGRHVGVDIWHAQPDGRGLLPALRFLIPYYLGEKEWTHQQVSPFRPATAALLLSLATGSKEPDILTASTEIPGHPWNRISYYQASARENTKEQ